MPIEKWGIYRNQVNCLFSYFSLDMLVLTFLIFSYRADFCYDYSVWKYPNGSNKHECYKPGPIGESWYTELRNCKMHPSRVTKEQCKQRGNEFFYCQHSQTCIHSKFTCDGVFNCIEGNSSNQIC